MVPRETATQMEVPASVPFGQCVEERLVQPSKQSSQGIRDPSRKVSVKIPIRL